MMEEGVEKERLRQRSGKLGDATKRNGRRSGGRRGGEGEEKN